MNKFSIAIQSQKFNKNKVAPFAEIWECIETGEKFLHSCLNFMPGDFIANFSIRARLDNPNYLTVQIDETEHTLLDPEFLHYINHSCEPNIFFDTTNMVVTCLKKIDIGESMTFFYPSTEWSMEQGFDCLCRTEKCLGKIQGAAHLSPDILKNYKLSEHIRKKL